MLTQEEYMDVVCAVPPRLHDRGDRRGARLSPGHDLGMAQGRRPATAPRGGPLAAVDR